MRTASWVEYEHLELGLVRVLFRWVRGTHGEVWTPQEIEFDLFTPDEQQQLLIKLLRGEGKHDNLDWSISVSAIESYSEGDLPWE